MPGAEVVTFPVGGGDGWFYARLENVEYEDRVEDWLLAVDSDGRAWLGSPAVGGPQWATEDLPDLAGEVAVPLPAGEYGWRGSQRAFWSLAPVDVAGILDGAPAWWATGTEFQAAPEELDEAFDAALGRILLRRVIGWIPSLTGEVVGSLHSSETLPTLDLRFLDAVEPSETRWGERWRPLGVPEGAAMLRVEVPGDDMRRQLRSLLDQWGYEWPEPSGDFVVEAHLLFLRGRIGLAIFSPEDWALQRDWVTAALPFVVAVTPFLSNIPSEEELEAERFVSAGSVVWAAGSPGFLEDLKDELRRDRPAPFAERRWRWPRGAVGLIVDFQTLQDALRTATALPIPSLGAGGAQEWVLEAVMIEEGRDLRVHATLPRPERGGQLGSLLDRASGLVSAEVVDSMLSELGLERLETQ